MPGGEPIKLKVAYIGLTCEAPIFVAQEKGFYKDEGLDVKLVKADWASLQSGLGTGRFDANHTLIMYLLKPIEQGLDVKITGGIHTGCLRIQAGVNTDIKTVEDLRGKTIGVPAPFGSPPHMFASRVLAAHGINPKQDSKDVTWKAIQGGALEQAQENGEVQAVADAEPLGSRFIGDGAVKAEAVADQARDAPYKDEYCCVSVVSGQLARNNPAAAAKVTRALFKGAKWVSDNPKEASELSVEKQFIPSGKNILEINTQALLKLDYTPGVKRCRKSVDEAAADMKRAGLLKPETDPKALAKKILARPRRRHGRLAEGPEGREDGDRPSGLARPGGFGRPVRRPEVVLRGLLLRRRMTGRGRPNGRAPLSSNVVAEPPAAAWPEATPPAPPEAAVSTGRASAALCCRSPSRSWPCWRSTCCGRTARDAAGRLDRRRALAALAASVSGGALEGLFGGRPSCWPRRSGRGGRCGRGRLHYGPLAAGAVVRLSAWDLITLKLNWMTLPYFPGPDAVLAALVEDRALLFESTWRSLLLLLTGYTVGVAAGLVAGVLIGWFPRVRYWGMPVLKVIGPLPATALVHVVMTASSQSFVSAAALIAFAVWFPVTMLTYSGISNVRVSYLDVARTLGAGRLYLIFRVALPSALPNIFLGLFMGLGASFLTLIVAETVGRPAGLGWYLTWQQGFVEYANVYASILIMMVFFSTLMTLLFKVRDRVLRWQKGVIKW